MKKDFSPKRIGPGCWYTMSITAKNAENEGTEEAKNACIFVIRSLSKEFDCQSCRKHFQNILEMFPPENYRNKLSKWIWKSKNIVNKRMGRKEISFSEYKKIFNLKN